VRNAARRRTTTWLVVVVGTMLGGAGAAAWYLDSADADSAPPPPPPLAAGQSADGLARAVVDRLNAKDLPGVIELTCAQGKTTGQRELATALPPLDPAAPPSARNVQIQFTLGEVKPFTDGYVAVVQIQYQGTTQDGKMRIQRSGDRWSLCGMDSPRFNGTG